MKPISGKIKHNRVGVKNLRLSVFLPKLFRLSCFILHLAGFCAKMIGTLWGLKEEGNSHEPTVRSNVPGLVSKLIGPESGLFVQFFRPEREISATDWNNLTRNQRLTFWSE